MNAPRASATALLLLIATGCAGFNKIPECPEKGGAPWRELTSSHFRIKTNLDSPAAHEVAAQLEKYRRALCLTWGPSFDPPGQVDAIVFRSLPEFKQFAAKYAGLMAQQRGGPLLVMAGESYLIDSGTTPTVQLHELAHYLSHFVLLRQPRWVSEGLASYLETVHLTDNDSKVVMGRADPYLLTAAQQSGRMPLAELWLSDAKDYDEPELRRFYASSWVWMHFLFNTQPDRMTEFQQRLARAEDPRKAWEAAFTGVDRGDLERELNVYMRHGRGAVLTFALPPTPTEVSEHSLTDAEVHALRAQVWMVAVGTPAPERRAHADLELAEALRQDPTNATALLLKADRSDSAPERLSLARQVTEHHPESTEAWGLWVEALKQGPGSGGEERSKVIAAAQAHAPHEPSVLQAVSLLALVHGQTQAALVASSEAVALRPWSPGLLTTYSFVLQHAGRCPEALSMQRRALDALHETATPKDRKRFEQLVEEREHQCGDASPGAPQ